MCSNKQPLWADLQLHPHCRDYQDKKQLRLTHNALQKGKDTWDLQCPMSTVVYLAESGLDYNKC